MTDIQVLYTGPIVNRAEAIKLGLDRYFTGKPCKNGHVEQRVTKKCDCLQCNRDRNKDYRSIPENAEKAKERSKEWRSQMDPSEYYDYIKSIREKNYGSNAAYWRDYNSRNKEVRRAQSKEYYNLNVDKIKASGEIYRKENEEEIRRRKKEYYDANKEVVFAANRRRRGKLRDAEGTHTVQDVKSIYAEQDGECVYCGADLLEGYHVDHIMPLALGGSNWPDNLQCLCPTCNLRKGSKHPDDWHNEIGYT